MHVHVHVRSKLDTLAERLFKPCDLARSHSKRPQRIKPSIDAVVWRGEIGCLDFLLFRRYSLLMKGNHSDLQCKVDKCIRTLFKIYKQWHQLGGYNCH